LLRGFIHAVFAYPEAGLTMKEIQAFHSALQKASHETTKFMTSSLRSEARKSGWPSHVVANMGVTYGDNGFEAHVHDRHIDEAKNLEYGTETSRPTAAVRRFKNRQSESSTFLAGRLSHHLGKL